MKILKIEKHWRTFFTFEGGNEHCDHEYDNDAEYNSTDYTGTVDCIKCGCKMSYDVSDIGD
jgi:hypothetical protein